MLSFLRTLLAVVLFLSSSKHGLLFAQAGLTFTDCPAEVEAFTDCIIAEATNDPDSLSCFETCFAGDDDDPTTCAEAEAVVCPFIQTCCTVCSKELETFYDCIVFEPNNCAGCSGQVPPTPPPVIPTSAPIFPTPSPVVPTPSPIVPTPSSVVPTPSPVVFTPSPVVPTPSPSDNTPVDPPTPSSPTPTMDNSVPTPSPVTRTSVPLAPFSVQTFGTILNEEAFTEATEGFLAEELAKTFENIDSVTLERTDGELGTDDLIEFTGSATFQGLPVPTEEQVTDAQEEAFSEDNLDAYQEYIDGNKDEIGQDVQVTSVAVMATTGGNTSGENRLGSVSALAGNAVALLLWLAWAV